MKAHIVKNDVVVNSIEVDSLESFPDLNLVENSEIGIGWKLQGGVWVAPEPDLTEDAKGAREQRDEKLIASDWTQIATHLTTEQKNAWEIYRQALRDVPQQEGFPLLFEWPVEP